MTFDEPWNRKPLHDTSLSCTVEVTVEEQRQVIALCAQHVHVVQGRQRDDFVFFQMHDYVVYFDVQASVPHPDEFVEAFVTL